ncbi:predicted protein [Naegleria gruberi]|uniref:Predicted protein n=1 Tax=Naegleria gruberi TaxID=5762 RepID=D2VFU1_NAEGR|nr:uncharacterized protein NAEGRDRAFT_79811 [Naegleria gruberi]EFC44248.1 predicted protein [Naegleria gruberi]|eukprot:XP_002676992.1 predicted protein [Naegleria gruberi strain NEG-M]
MPAGGQVIFTNSTVGTSGFGVNVSLLKGNTITQTIVGAIISAMVVASVVVTIVMVTVSAGVSAPDAKDDYIQVYKRYPITIYPLLNDADPKSLNLTLVNVTQPTSGTVSLKDGKTLVYTSKGSFAGNETFQYYVTNGYMISSANVHVEVLNRPPELVDITLTVSKNSKKNSIDIFAYVTDNGAFITDPDNDELTVVGITASQVPEAVVTFDTKYVYYTPKYGFNAQDQFNYTVSDGNAIVSALITINVENDPPVADPDTYTVPKNAKTILRVMENDYDINGDNITIVASTSGTGSAGTVITSSDATYLSYIPPAKVEALTDAFEYTITDGPTTSSSYVFLKVVNTPPNNADRILNVPKNSKDNQLDLTYTDADMLDTVTVSLLTKPTRGTFQFLEQSTITQVNYPTQDFYNVKKNSYTMVYTPEDGVIYSESFKLRITDDIDTVTSTVTINVIPVAPVAVNDTVLCDKNVPITVDVVANDYSASNDYLLLDFDELSTENGGKIKKIDDKNVTYTPPADFTGTDVAPYKVKNSNKDGSTTGIFTVTGYLIVGVKNIAPVAVDDIVKVSKGLVGKFELISNDYDPNSDAIQYDLATGVVTRTQLADGTDALVFTSKSSEKYSGETTFTYTVSDYGKETVANVVVTLRNDAPLPVADSYTFHWKSSDNQLNVLANDKDPNNDALFVDTVSKAADFKGSVSIDAQRKAIVFSPVAASVGTQEITYIATDDVTKSASSSVTLIVTNNNVPQDQVINKNIHWSTQKTGGTTIDMFSTPQPLDADGDSLSILSTSTPSKGSVAINNGDASTIPNHFDVVVSGYTRDAVVMCGANDADNEDTVTVKTVSVNVGGSATFSGNMVTFVGQQGYTGASIVTITFTDGLLTKSVDWTINILNNDPVVTVFPTNIHWTQKSTLIDVLSAVNWTLPDSPVLGDSSFTAKFTDGWVSKTGTFVVSVKNTAPTATVKNIEAHWSVWSTGITIDVLSGCTDADSDSISLQSVSSATSGSTLKSNGKAIYTPTKGFVGTGCSTVASGAVKVVNFASSSFTGTAVCTATLTDGLDSSTKTLTTTSYNNPPTAADISVTYYGANVQTGITIEAVSLATDSDTDDSAYLVVSNVGASTRFGSGAVTIDSSNKKIKYFPSPALVTQTGIDTFTYQIYDGLIKSAVATVTVDIRSVVPSAEEKYFDVHWRKSLVGQDFYAFDNITSYGTLELNKILNVAPNKGDGLDSSATQTVTINLQNYAPTSSDQTFSNHWRNVQSGFNINLLADARDADGDSLSVSYYSQPAVGTLTAVSSGVVKFVPPANQVLSTSFQFKITDGAQTVTQTCSDPNSDPLTFSGVTQGSLGSVVVTDSSLGSFTYQPSTSITYTNTPSDGSAYTVSDSFSYSCTDGPLSTSGQVSVTITNTPPQGTSKTANVTRNYSNPTTILNNLLVGASDADGDSVTVASVALLPNQNSGTSVVLNTDGSVKFTYANSFIGTQQFYVYLTDGQLTTSYIYTINIVGSALNCIDYYISATKNDAANQFEDSLRLALVKVSGSEPASINLVSTANLKVGTIAKVSSKWTYTADSTRSCINDNCYATYSYSNTAGQTVSCKIIVNQPNTAPVAPSYNHIYSVSRATNVAQTIDYLAVSNAYDADTADKLKLTSITNTGTCTSTLVSSISVVSNKISFLRQTTFVGSSCWFIVGVSDSDVDAPVTVSANITITPLASPPIAVNDVVSTKYNAQVDISVSTLLSNDYDSLGGTFKFASISCPTGYCASGTPTILNPNDPANSQVIRVKPVANSCDSIQFEYTIVSDQDGTSSSATVTVQYTSCTCSLDMDIIFVLDGSGSISDENWIKMKSFMGNVTRGFGSNISPTGTNIGIIQFASSITTHLQVNSGTSVDVVLSKISSASQLKSGTGSIAGINAAIDQMVSYGRKSIVNKMIIHVTDGESTEPCSCSGCTSSFSANPLRYGSVPNYCKSNRFPGMNCSNCLWNDSRSRCNPCSEATLRSADLNSWSPGVSTNAEVSKYAGTGIWNWRQLAIGIGVGLTSALGKVQIQRMNYDTNNPLYVDWNNLANVYQLVVDNSCNTVTSSQTKTLVPLANSGMTVTYKGKTTSVIKNILSTNWVRSQFNYTVAVASSAPSGVKKFSLAMASGYNQDAFYNYNPYFPVYLGVEPITNKDSFSFESAPGVYTIAKGSSFTYSLTVEGDVTEDSISFGVFGDSQYATGTIKGPASVIAPYNPQPPAYVENSAARKTACSATLGRCYIYTKFVSGYTKSVMSDICKYWRSDAKLVMIQSAAEKTFIQTILPAAESITFPLGMTYTSGAGTWDDGTSTAAFTDYLATSSSGPVVYANYVYTAPTNKWWTTAAATTTTLGVVCWAPFA